jgi:uncharacterized RDD family membrane protein YckC
LSNEITIITPEHVELRFEIAGPGSRLLALLVDQIIIIILTIIILLILAAFSFVSFSSSSERGLTSTLGIALLMVMFLPTLYFFLFETFMHGKTPGKAILGIRVIRDTGHALDVRGALLRNLMRIVDQLPVLYMTGSVVVFFSAQSRRIGDYVGGTLVVREPNKMSKIERETTPELYKTVAKTEAPQIRTLPEPVLAQIGAITKDDYRAVRHLLDRSAELDTNVVNSAAWKMVTVLCEKMQCDPSEIRDPLRFLFDLTNEWEHRKVH